VGRATTGGAGAAGGTESSGGGFSVVPGIGTRLGLPMPIMVAPCEARLPGGGASPLRSTLAPATTRGVSIGGGMDSPSPGIVPPPNRFFALGSPVTVTLVSSFVSEPARCAWGAADWTSVDTFWVLCACGLPTRIGGVDGVRCLTSGAGALRPASGGSEGARLTNN
jgi:hypothetical protein